MEKKRKIQKHQNTRSIMEIRTEKINNTTDSIIEAHVRLLESYTTLLRTTVEENDYTVPESALRVPFDTNLLAESKEVAQRYKGVKKVFLMGIGGSDMGVHAVYDALRGYHGNTDGAPELYDFGTIEPKVIHRAKRIIQETEHSEDIVCIVISKSGKTTETIANANTLFGLFEEKFGAEKAVQQTIVITGNDSPLHTKATEQGITVVHFPEMVGGRFSVLTGVGLIPLAILGFNVDAFCEGARKGILASVTENGSRTGAVLASLLFEAYLKGARIHELFFWNPELETLGKWYRQLLAESIGKEQADGTKIGYSPSIAVGSIDLHSLGQLIFGGRNDRFTTFIYAPCEWHHERTFKDESPFTLPMFTGKTMEDVLNAMYTGVKNTYTLHKLDFFTIELAHISERELGAFMSLHMTVIMYLAQLLNVNAFDQPAVEMYKNETRDLLTKQ
jgi:glucose-6-phosphate isomerase